MTSPITLTQYQQIFEPSIKAMLNWDKLHSLDVTVSTEIVSSAEQLANFFTVWHQSKDGLSWASWDDEGAVPQTVDVSATRTDLWDEERTRKIEQLRLGHRVNQEPAIMMLPGYRVPKGVILLDATHRTLAAYLEQIPVRFLIFAIDGPIDESILPDLRNHQL